MQAPDGPHGHACQLPTRDVTALERVTVAPGDVPPAIDHSGHSRDAEVDVSHCQVARERRRGALHVEAVVSCTCGDVAHQDAMVVRLVDEEPIGAAHADPIAADNVVTAANRRPFDSKPDARLASLNDDVAGDHVGASLLDEHATPVSKRTISHDQVSVAGPHDDAGSVSHAAVAPERVVEDADVVRTEQAHPGPVGSEVAASRTVPDQASGRLGHHEAKEDVPGRRDAHHAVAACPPDKRANSELAYRAVQDRNAILAVVEYADVAELVLGAWLERLTVTIDRVAVQIQGDVVCPDHDAVVRTVDEVAVKRRVGGDRGAAVEVARPCSGAANDLEASHHKGDDHNHRGEL